MVRPGLAGAALHRVAIVDRFQGAFAGGLVIVGVLRVIYGLKGPDFYLSSWTFWAKMAAFAGGRPALAPADAADHRLAQGRARPIPACVVPDAEIRRRPHLARPCSSC